MLAELICMFSAMRCRLHRVEVVDQVLMPGFCRGIGQQRLPQGDAMLERVKDCASAERSVPAPVSAGAQLHTSS